MVFSTCVKAGEGIGFIWVRNGVVWSVSVWKVVYYEEEWLSHPNLQKKNEKSKSKKKIFFIIRNAFFRFSFGFLFYFVYFLMGLLKGKKISSSSICIALGNEPIDDSKKGYGLCKP